MTNITAIALNNLQSQTWKACQEARGHAGNDVELVDIAWQCAKDETAAAADNDSRAGVAQRFLSIFQGFSSFTQDEREIIATPVWTGERATIEAMKRKVLDKRPALAAFMLERDAFAKALQERIDRNREAEAERHRAALPGLLLSRIRAAGYDLTLDGKGRLCAPHGTPLDQGYGVDIYTERKAEFVAILKAEAEAAAAEAKRLAPVVIA